MKNHFIEHFDNQSHFHKNDKILLAVSGGIDSIVLAHLFKQSGLNFGIAHCNFNLRGKDSDNDEEFVRQLADTLNVPFFHTRFETKTYAEANKLTIQTAARNLRYEWIEKVRLENDFMWIATAHHLDDSIETFFINLLRGTGLTGLQGIPQKNGRIIRPLLNFTKADILHFANSHNISFREDASNLTEAYQRNKIRHQLIPALKNINPDYQKVFAGNLKKLKDAEQIKQTAIENWLNKHLKKTETGDLIISKLLLQKTKIPHPYLSGFLTPFGFNSKQVDEILQNIDIQSGKQFISNTHRLIIDRKHLILTDKQSDKPAICLIEKGDDVVTFNGQEYRFSVIGMKDFLPGIDDNIAYFNYNKIEFPLFLRKWKKGDYFYPFGMKLKKKKVSDLFSNMKISQPEKERIDILLSNKKIS